MLEGIEQLVGSLEKQELEVSGVKSEFSVHLCNYDG